MTETEETGTVQHRIATVFAQPATFETLRNIVFSDLRVGETHYKALQLSRGDVRESTPTHTSSEVDAKGPLADCAVEGKELSCEECGLKFKQISRLRIHMRVHSGERPFNCDQCGKTFKRRSHAKSHYVRFHCGEKPHECDTCGMCFKELYELQKHARVHSDERPHKCPVCDKTFKWSYSVKAHLRVHSTNKPFSCDVCNKHFKRQGSLKKHGDLHKLESTHHCVTCGDYNKHPNALEHEDVPLQELSEETSNVLSSSHNLQSQMDYSDVSQISESLNMSQPPLAPPQVEVLRKSSPLKSDPADENKLFLNSLTCAEVLKLLDDMGLSQHKECFSSERVDGELFAECDDEILKNDLKVNSKLQRLRLMKVITGKHSARAILQNQDSHTSCSYIDHSSEITHS